MKLPLTLILLGSAMATAAAAQGPVPATPPSAHARAIGDLAAPLLQVSDDEDDDNGWFSFGDDGSDEADCDEDEEDCPTAGRGNAAPAGTVAPPANGLFGDGKAPVASTN